LLVLHLYFSYLHRVLERKLGFNRLFQRVRT
jgi:hypothetical protein